jgi:hypothetical protein
MQKIEYKDIANIDHKVAVVGLNFLLNIFHIRFKDKEIAIRFFRSNDRA